MITRRDVVALARRVRGAIARRVGPALTRRNVALACLVIGVLLAGLGLTIAVVPGDSPVSAQRQAGGSPTEAPTPTEDPSDQRVAEQTPKSRGKAPVGLALPSIGVHAPVVRVQSHGSVLDPPADTSVIGWWSDGARPGATTGTALLTGHTVHEGDGVLDDLDQMRAGQRVRVSTHHQTLDYAVSSVATYSKRQFAKNAPEILDQGASGRLAIVTCEDWVSEGVYRSNVVVVAEPVV